MNVVLTCTECEYQEKSLSEKELMNKIIMWNHTKKIHPGMAERIMRIYEMVPSDLYDVQTA